MALVPSQFMIGETEAPRETPLPLQGGFQLRLVIAVPVMLALAPIIFGLVSYLSFSGRWDELDKLGASRIAGELLETHLTTMLVLAALGAISGIGVAMAILRPVRSLMEAAKSVAGGHLDRRAPAIHAAPELEELSRSFNAMIDRINGSLAERNRELIQGLPLGVLSVDPAGRVSAASEAASRVLGLSAEWLVGRSVAELTLRVRPEARPLLQRINDRAAPDAGDADPFHLTRTGLRSSDGAPAGEIFSFREPAAVREVSAHLRRTDELASLGAFALGLAHQLRNPLGAVKGLSQLLLSDRSIHPEAESCLKRMVGEVDRVDRFVSQLLTLSDSPLSPPSVCDPAALLHEAEARARREAGHERAEAVVLREDFKPAPSLMLERDRVAHALSQIVKNAYLYTPAGGEIVLSTRAAGDGSSVELRVRNTGSTISESDRELVFQPFFTTDDRATGLGLTFAREIVSQNGGALELETGAGGVEFIVRFGSDRIVDPRGAVAMGRPS